MKITDKQNYENVTLIKFYLYLINYFYIFFKIYLSYFYSFKK